MDSSQFGKYTAARAATLTRYFNNEGITTIARETLRFVDDNFRLQGWQGASFQPWARTLRSGIKEKPSGTILVLTGALRRSFNFQSRGNGEIYFYNNLPYAKVHNEGFRGTVKVRPHTRATYLKAKATDVATRRKKTILSKTGEKQIGASTRRMNIVQRQFAPYEGHESPVLNAAIIKDLTREITNIFKF